MAEAFLICASVLTPFALVLEVGGGEFTVWGVAQPSPALPRGTLGSSRGVQLVS